MVCLRSAEGLLAGGHQEAVPALIGLLNPEREESNWRADDLLRRIAGDKGIDPLLDEKPASRLAYQKAWAAWWKQSAKGIDLTKVSSEPLVLGLWVGIEYNTNSVWECGRDGKRRWTIQASGPMDAQVITSNRVLIAEQTAKRVTERDLKGNILWQFDTKDTALNCQRLANGNTFIATRHAVMEVRADKTVVFEHRLSNESMNAIRRMPNGRFVGISGGGVIHEMNPDGTLVRSVALKHEGTWNDVLSLPGNRYLVSNSGAGFVREIDADGKILHELKIVHACGLERLANGQLLVCGAGSASITDWTGNRFWEVKTESPKPEMGEKQGFIRRIHQR
jgi:hypothetical protein